LRVQERDNWNFFIALPEFDRRKLKTTQLRQQRSCGPLFEFSGACAGCGERHNQNAVATFRRPCCHRECHGCSSIYGGNLADHALRLNIRPGPTWCNSLSRTTRLVSASRVSD